MSLQRAFTAEPGFTPDYFAVRAFLQRLNADTVRAPGFLWARWEWAFCLSIQDRSALDRIGVWEAGGEVVALATFEAALGKAFLVCDPAHRDVLPDMVEHAVGALADPEGRVRVMVPDDDRDLARLLLARGFRATAGREPNSVVDVRPGMHHPLPAGYRLKSVADGVDLAALERLMWLGFGHPGEPDRSAESLEWQRRGVSSPATDPSLNVIAVAPDGSYAAYCGTWLEPGSHYATVEPVCTDPDHRRRGCASAVILEALSRCAERGATEAYVGSDQPVYHSLGFAPVLGGTWFARPEAQATP